MVTVGEVPLTEMVLEVPARTSGVVMLTLPAVVSTAMAVARFPLMVRMPLPPMETGWLVVTVRPVIVALALRTDAAVVVALAPAEAKVTDCVPLVASVALPRVALAEADQFSAASHEVPFEPTQ